MLKLFNLDHQPQVIDHDKPAVQPGASHEFTDADIAAGVSGSWSEHDPRSGLAAEKAFKKRRDKRARAANVDKPDETAERPSTQETQDPAGAGEPEE